MKDRGGLLVVLALVLLDRLLGEVCRLPRPNEVFRLSHGVLFSLRAASIWRRPVAAAVAGCPAVAVPGPGQLAARVVVR